MNIAMIDSGFDDLVTTFGFVDKRHYVTVFEKNTPSCAIPLIPFCLASARIIVNEIPA